jgi:hypothetical protein
MPMRVWRGYLRAAARQGAQSARWTGARPLGRRDDGLHPTAWMSKQQIRLPRSAYRENDQDSTPRAYPPSMQRKTTALAGAAIVLAGCGGSSHTAVTLTSTLQITKTVTVTAPPPPSVPKTTMETDGTYRVGTDIVPGTYRSAGASPEGASDCYWARLNSLNETHIIDSNISTGPQVVVIQPSDRAFLTHSCQPWQKAG